MDYKKQSAFTIVELLVVIVVIGILATISIVSYTGITNKATVASLSSDLDNASKLLKMEQVTNDTFPATLAEVNDNRGVPASPGTTYQYIYNNTANPKSFCITASKDSTSYKISNNSPPIQGTCQTSGIVTNGLILSLDAANNASYPGLGTAWTDLGGSGNHGSLINGVGYNTANNGVLIFDGTDDYITVADSGSLKPANQISYSFWVKPTTFSGWNCVFGKYNIPRIQFGGGKLYLDDFPSANKPGANLLLSNTTFSTNNWYFITYIYDGSSLSLYVNGVLDNSLSTFNGLLTWNNSDYTIGTPAYLPYGFVNFFYGQIPNLQIYNRSLSPAEITQNFNALRGRYGL